MQRGDIVWARPNNWWLPALVLSSHEFGVSLSFSFFHHQNHVVSRNHFLHSELLPFEEAFPSLLSSHHNRRALFSSSLHSALRFLGLRVISGLRCQCQVAQAQAQRVLNGPNHSSQFDPVGLLGFVLDAAVSPWVEAPRLAHAVRVVAQVHAFRSYSSVRYKKIYKQTKKTGDNVKLDQCCSLDQRVQLVTQESLALEPKQMYPTILKETQTNMDIGAIRRLKSTVPVLEGNPEHLYMNKLLIISRNPLHSPALGSLYMAGESLIFEGSSLLRFKNTSRPGMDDICLRNCSTMSKTGTSAPFNFKTPLRNCVNKRKDNVLRHYCRLSDLETAVYHNRKRRRLDEPALCYVTPQIGGFHENEGNACKSKYTRFRISHTKTVEPEENKACTCFCQANMNFNDEVQKVDLERSQNLSLQQSLTCKSSSNLVLGSDNCVIDDIAAKVKGLLGSNYFVYQERLPMSCNGNTIPLELESSSDCLVEGNNCHQLVASCSIFNSKVGQQSKTLGPFSPKSLHLKFPRNFNLPSKEQLIKKFSVFGSVDSSKTRVFCYTGSAQVTFLQEADAVAAYLYDKKVLFGEANVRFWLDPFEHKRRGFKSSALVTPSASKQIGPPRKSCLKLPMSCNSNTTPLELKSSSDCFVEGNDCHQRVASCSIFNSKVGQQSKTHLSFSPKSLHMKFPKNFNLPSKEQLIKKFRVFGSVDSSKTRVFRYTGSAQVAFLQEADTVAAYLYAKRKVLFGEANVRFWLDPFEHKRRGLLSPPASKQIGPPLKSCLKNSNSLRKENTKKKHYRVRFTIET